MTVKDTRAASFRIESDKWLDFVAKAKENNTDSSKLLRDWIDSYLSDNGIQDESNDIQDVIDEDAVRAIVRVEIEEQLDRSIEEKINQLQQGCNKEEVLSLAQRLDELEKSYILL